MPPLGFSPRHPSRLPLAPTQGHHHMNINQAFPALSGLLGPKLHFPVLFFLTHFLSMIALLLPLFPLAETWQFFKSHWQLQTIYSTATWWVWSGKYWSPQIIVYMAHWPQSEKFDSNTKRRKIFCWAFALSISFSMEFKVTWALITGITCSFNCQVWPVAHIAYHSFVVAGSGLSTRSIFRREIRSRVCFFIF